MQIKKNFISNSLTNFIFLGVFPSWVFFRHKNWRRMGIFWWRPRDGRHQLVIRVTVFPAAIFPASVCAALYHSVCIFCCATRLSWSASGRLIEKATSCRKPSDEQQQQSAPAKKKKNLSPEQEEEATKRTTFLSLFTESRDTAQIVVSHCVDDDDQVCGQITARPVPHFEKRAKGRHLVHSVSVRFVHFNVMPFNSGHNPRLRWLQQHHLAACWQSSNEMELFKHLGGGALKV